MNNKWQRALGLIAAAVALQGTVLIGTAAAARTAKVLDDGVTTVQVDNFSSWSDVHAGGLALVADRSTKDDGMWVRPRKGLFQTNDRIFVNNHYLAWFRQSYLFGVWTLNPASADFLHKRTGPNGFTNWSHNELLMGSASPQQQTWLFDTFSTGIEYSMVFGGPAENLPWEVTLNHTNGFAAAGAIATQWTVMFDGAPYPLGLDGIVYATSTKVPFKFSGTTGPWLLDIYDGNDANGVQNVVESQVAYIMRAEDIRVVWRFKPSTLAINPWGTFYHVWQNYSFDVDGTSCDFVPGNHSPDQVWGEPQFFKSSVTVTRAGAPLTAGVTHGLLRGVACQDNNQTWNFGAPPAHGDYMTWGESSTLASNTPKWTLTHQVDSAWGTPVPTTQLIFGNESVDGVWGFGASRDDRNPNRTPFQGGAWHVMSFLLKTK